MQSGETLMDMPANSLVPGVPARPSFAWRPVAEADALGEAYGKQLGCSGLACLRALPVKKILTVPQIMNASG
jgi:para-nitrobenzyl esterase